MFISEMLPDGPSLTFICIGFLGLGIIGMSLSLLRWWASIPIIAILLLYAALLLSELYADDLYPHYSQDPKFLYSATIAIVIGMLLPIAGIAINIARRFNKIK